MSTDQLYGYNMVAAVRAGSASDQLANLEPGPVNHSRWLTTANRFLRLWISDHGFTGEEANNLKLICNYIVSVYYPMWFYYKMHNDWLEGPRACLEQLRLTLQQPMTTISLVFPHLESSAWWCHPEQLLQTLLCSEDTSDRVFAIKKVLKTRTTDAGQPPKGHLPRVRTRRKVTLNRTATSLQNLIVWDENNVTEPVLTRDLTKEDLMKIRAAPMEVAHYPVHGQGVERCVREVTVASESVFGEERRDGFIRARMTHRAITGPLRSKSDQAKICQQAK